MKFRTEKQALINATISTSKRHPNVTVYGFFKESENEIATNVLTLEWCIKEALLDHWRVYCKAINGNLCL